MPSRASFFIVSLYVAIVLAALGINWRADRQKTEVTRVPTLKLVREKGSAIAGVFPTGMPKLDLPVVKSSLSRLPVVALARQLGASLRLAGGQRLYWVIWGDKEPLMLFPTGELWASEGIGAENNRYIVDEAAKTAKKYYDLLKAEGWTLVIVPVPTKLSIYHDYCQWPILEKDPFSRFPVASDRADEVSDALFAHFDRENIPYVDLRAAYRAERAAHPRDLLYPLGESHWSGRGLEIASEATARKISEVTTIPFKPRVPTYLEDDEVADMASAFDADPRWLGRLQPIYNYHTRLVDGEEGKGYVAVPEPKSLMVLPGTSYSGQYTWRIGHPVGFAWVLGGLLKNCEIQNHAAAGMGSFYAFRRFLDGRAAIADDFARRTHLQDYPRVVVWEFPLRDLSVLVGQ